MTSENTRFIETNAPDASHYHTFKEQRLHVYQVPDMYVGSIDKTARDFYLFDIINKRYVYSNITLPEAVERLFLELISNGGDNAERSRACKYDPGKITINMDKNWVIIRTEGAPMPVEKNKDGIWVPYQNFGVMFSGSNFDPKKVRIGCGRNGVGGKAVNIFSKYFKAVVADSIRKKIYTQVWQNNMDPTYVSEPIIEDYKEKNSYIEISYLMDFERFGYKEYPDEALSLYAGYAADFSWTCKIPISFNGIDLSAISIKDYAKYYFGEDVNMIIHYEWPEEHQITDKNGKEIWVKVEFIEKKGLRVPKNPNIVPISELCILDTPDNNAVISFANGIRTLAGGVHVNSAVKAFTDIVLKEFNGKDDQVARLKPADVKQHISILLACRLHDPKYKSQTKEQLSSPTPKFNISDKEVKCVQNWKLIDRLYAQLEAKEFDKIAKTDGKKTKHVNVPNLEDANFAGTKNSQDAVLFLTEGRSAQGYINRLIGLLPGGRDKYGSFPLKGKGLNLLRATLKEILANAEYLNVKTALGARENTDYMNDANFATLRYGMVVIVSDADSDGKHIVGLTTLLFHCRFPSFIKRNCLWHLRTRTITVKKGKISAKFLTKSSYDTWKESNPNYQSYKHGYFKGLATSQKSDIEEDSKDLKLVNLQYDDKSDISLNMAFNKDSNLRKIWISEFKGVEEVCDLKIQNITNYVHNELILFEKVNLERNIPRIDGLKNGQRKILWYGYKHWKFNSSEDENLNVSAFSGHVKAETGYHYGDAALEDTIVNMARQYLGTNNLSYFFPAGEFGSRYYAGDDAGHSRYINTYPMKWLNLVFKKEDIPLLNHVIDDGKVVEPELFLPIIPTVLINGQRAIGSGTSTFIPNFNPRDIAKWMKCKLEGKRLPKLTPWYSKFKGTIKIVNSTKIIKSKIIPEIKLQNEQNEEDQIIKEEKEKDREIDIKDTLEVEDNEEKIAFNDRYRMVTYGKMNIKDNGTIIIDELPIGKSTSNYDKFLAFMVKEGKIRDFKNLSNGFEDTVYFEVYGFEKPTYENLRLIKSYGLSNMNLLDENLKPIKFENVDTILEYFYQWRLPYMEKRRLNILKVLNDDKTKVDIKLRYITAVVHGTLNIIKRPEAEIKSNLDKLGVPYSIHDNTKNSELSEEKINKLNKEMNDLNIEIDWYNKITKEQLLHIDIVNFENNLSEL